MSRTSWTILLMGFAVLSPVVLDPSLFGFAAACASFALCWLLLRRLDRGWFRNAFPLFSSGILAVSDEKLAAQTEAQKSAFFAQLVAFPLRRAHFTVALLLLAAVPSCYLLAYWQSDAAVLSQTLKLVSITLLAVAYFFGAVFIENHEYVSSQIATIHKKHDWSQVFNSAHVPSLDKDRFQIHARLSLLAIGVSMIAAQLLAAVTTQSGPWLAVEILTIGIVGLVMMGRLLWLERRYFVDGMGDLFLSLETSNPEKDRTVTALHTTNLLAQFERSFNSLVERLRAYEYELSHWIFVRTEQSRYRALGEVSGMIAHDLSAPLHVIDFCTRQLKEDPRKATNPKYLEQLSKNGARSLELLNSIRDYLKAPPIDFRHSRTNFWDAFVSVRTLLETRFNSVQIRTVKITASPELEVLYLRIAKPDLIHILLNIMANCIENLEQNKVANGEIKVSVVKESKPDVVVSISDNGSGLEPERFEEMTSFVYMRSRKSFSREGLGLRLVRRLAERSGGTLKVVPSSVGTDFRLQLTGSTYSHLKAVKDGKEQEQTHLDH